MKNIIVLLSAILSLNLAGQPSIKKFFKYSTFYSSGILSQPMQEATKDYFVTQGGDVFDVTEVYPADYSISVGIRKVARFDYENRPGRFYTGHEDNVTTESNIGPVSGWEYLFQGEKACLQGNKYMNQQYFLRYLGKRFIAKGEYIENGIADLAYSSADLRFRLPIGKKLNLSAGGVIRTHQAYGYNPIEEYLSVNPWWNLAYAYGYGDNHYGIDNDNDDVVDRYDWWWTNPDGERVADTDLDFRRNVFKDIVNEYNDSLLSGVGQLTSASMVVGLDYYHYAKDFWLHAYGSAIVMHRHVAGPKEFSYQYYVDTAASTQNAQWVDYKVGLVAGAHVTKSLGVFVECSNQRYWDRNVYYLKLGLNYQFR